MITKLPAVTAAEGGAPAELEVLMKVMPLEAAMSLMVVTKSLIRLISLFDAPLSTL